MSETTKGVQPILEDIHKADLENPLSSDAERHWCSMSNSLLQLLGFPQWWHCHMGRGYTMFPANMKPHVIAAMFNMETSVNGTEQGTGVNAHESDC